MATNVDRSLKGYGYVVSGTIILHPFALVRTLIQVGVEPIKPTVYTNYFGTKSLSYPGVFPYARHIVSVDGWSGLFRGVVPHASYALLLQISNDLLRLPVDQAVRGCMDRVVSRGSDVPDNEEGVQTLQHAVVRYFRGFCVSSIVGIISCSIFHPLKVIAVRSMVQFDGKETAYSNIISAFKEIYNNEGICGFFAGLAPLLVSRVGAAFFQNLISLVLQQAMYHWVPEGIHESYNAFKQVFANFVAGHLMYPCQLVSTVMIVNGSGLKAGQFEMAPFNSWWLCYSHLYHHGQWYRGSNIIFSRKTSVLSQKL